MLTTTEYLSVGEDAAGTLNIESAGSVSVGSFMEIGDDPESTGTVTIKGAGSMLTTTEYLSVGEDAAGTLNIESAGSVSVGSFMEIGDDPESTGTVTIKGAGSMLTTTEYLSIQGEDAAGTLNIESAQVRYQSEALSEALWKLVATPGARVRPRCQELTPCSPSRVSLRWEMKEQAPWN